MKKIQKKLVLKKKTIAQLNEKELSNNKLNKVQGGGTYCCYPTVTCPTATCKACTQTCPTYCADSQGNWC